MDKKINDGYGGENSDVRYESRDVECRYAEEPLITEAELCEGIASIVEVDPYDRTGCDDKHDSDAQHVTCRVSPRKRGRPRKEKPVRQVQILLPWKVNIKEILRRVPSMFVKSKKKVGMHWKPKTKWINSRDLDPNKTLWIISAISFFESTKKDDSLNEYPFAEISGKYFLNRIRGEYVHHVRLLEKAGVIEVDHSYSNGFDTRGYRVRKSKSKGYRIAKEFLSPLIWRTIAIDLPRIEKEGIPFLLSDPFFKELDFDPISANEYVNSCKASGFTENLSIEEGDKNSCKAGSFTRKQFRIEAHMKHSIRKMQSKSFTVKRDTTSFRANSVITQMNSALRKFIYCKGRMLYSIDLKNSQPFLFSILLDLVFGSHSSSFFGISGGVLCGHMSFTKNQKTEYPAKMKALELLEEMKLLPNAEGGDRFHATEQNLKEVDEFFSLCRDGKLYEYFLEIFQLQNEEGSLIDRDAMKKLFIKYLYSPSRYRHRIIKPIMESRFPFVNALIGKLKVSEDGADVHERLPILLQSMESHVFIDVVARKLHDEHGILFGTLHDSIITTEENIDLALKVITDAFLSEYGVEPTLDVSCWNKPKAEVQPEDLPELLETSERLEISKNGKESEETDITGATELPEPCSGTIERDEEDQRRMQELADSISIYKVEKPNEQR